MVCYSVGLLSAINTRALNLYRLEKASSEIHIFIIYMSSYKRISFYFIYVFLQLPDENRRIEANLIQRADSVTSKRAHPWS